MNPPGLVRGIKRKKLTARQRDEVFTKTWGRCAYCGCIIKRNNFQVDHLIPLAQGGPDTLDNCWPACRSCNHYKGSCTIDCFRATVEAMPFVLARDSITYKNAVRFGLVIPKPAPVVFFFEQMGQAAAAGSDEV